MDVVFSTRRIGQIGIARFRLIQMFPLCWIFGRRRILLEPTPTRPHRQYTIFNQTRFVRARDDALSRRHPVQYHAAGGFP
ncbi:hypothetical protein LA22_05600, partial [Xanthomonas oryzae pv. oryzae]